MEGDKRQAINGVGGSALNEALPNYNVVACENVTEGKNNTFIVMGRDRPSDPFSGYGGKGIRKSGAIDIVAGRTSAVIIESKNGQKVYTDPSIPFDAARITVVQKTDVDDNFYLPDGKIGNRKNRSAFIAKADNIRIVAREGIKLVANTDRFDSNGELKIRKFGIDLLATDGKDIQPIPKGDNLKEVIDDIYEKIAIAGSGSAVIISLLLSLLTALATHTHPSAMGPTGPSVELIIPVSQMCSQLGLQATEAQQIQLLIQKAKLVFLNPASDKYINSLFHNVD